MPYKDAKLAREKAREYSRRYRQRNAESVKEYERAYREQNAEKVRAASRAWRSANVARANEINRAYREANADALRAYRIANREREREAKRAYYLANRQRILARNQAWRSDNPEKAAEIVARRRARRRGVIVEVVDRAAIIARDRSTCHLCGLLVPADDIHLDHVVPLALGGEHTAANLKVTHSLCNLRKGAR